jgi:signal transduction histidine kinase
MKLDFLSDINKGYEEALGYKSIDSFIIKLAWWHLGIFTLVALLVSVFKVSNSYPSPLSWRVISISSAAICVVLAFVATSLVVFLHGKLSDHYRWRVLVSVAFVVYSYLFIYISGGSIEMHFHFFMIATVLAVFSDWRLGWILLALTALHHGVLNFVEPGWVYYYGRNDFAVVSHALPVLVTVIFTTVLCVNHRRALVDIDKMKRAREAELDQIDTLLAEKETMLAQQQTVKAKQPA